jgi:hypothetical protein
MNQDRRFKDLKIRIDAGDIAEFRDIFDTVPKTVVGHELLKNPARMDDLIDHPEKITVKDIYKISQAVKVKPDAIFNLTIRQYEKALHNKSKT